MTMRQAMARLVSGARAERSAQLRRTAYCRRRACHATLAGVKIPASFALWFFSFLTAIAADPTPELSALRNQAMGGEAAKIFAFAEALRKAESEEAFAWYVKAADRGHPEAAYLVFEGSFADDGLSIPKAEYDRLLGYLRRAAEGGFPPAQHRLGKFLESAYEVDGVALEPNWDESARWYRKAAAQKHPEGMRAWALAQLAGIGVPKDFASGLRDMKAAALAGHAKAQAYLADLYQSGEDPHENKVSVDWAESIRWRRRMIAAGVEGELLSLADSLLKQPNPSEADLAEARKLIEAQVADGNPNAREWVDLLAKKSAAGEQKARWEKVAARYAIFEKQFTGAISSLGRKRTLWKYRQWIQDQPQGIAWPELGEWSLRRMTPLLERQPAETYGLLASVPQTVISRELIERVLPGPLLAAWREGAQRARAAYDADEKYRAEIRQKYQAAYNGDGAAQLAVALAYLNQSDGRENQWAQAMHWLTLAKAKGVPGAADRLSRLSSEVNGRLKAAVAANDLSTIVELNRQKAASPMADAHIGAYSAGVTLLAKGQGSAEDMPEAESFLKAAAEKGHVDAMLELGKMHLIQQALPIDEAKALAWMRQAAERNHSEAKAWLDVLMPELGPAKRGELAQKVAGERMRVSDRTIDFLAAMPFSAYAARLGNEQARTFLDAVAKASAGNVVDNDGPTTLGQDQAGAKAGNAESMHRLAERYETGDGVGMDYDIAYDWFRRAAALGHADARTAMLAIAPRLPAAMFRIGRRYQAGDGVKQDLKEALAWYKKAAAAGVEDADEAAIDLESILTRDQEAARIAEQQRAMKQQIDAGAASTSARGR